MAKPGETRRPTLNIGFAAARQEPTGTGYFTWEGANNAFLSEVVRADNEELVSPKQNARCVLPIEWGGYCDETRREMLAGMKTGYAVEHSVHSMVAISIEIYEGSEGSETAEVNAK